MGTYAVVPQPDRPATRVYAVTDAGRAELGCWIAQPTTEPPVRSDLGVKLRGVVRRPRSTAGRRTTAAGRARRAALPR